MNFKMERDFMKIRLLVNLLGLFMLVSIYGCAQLDSDWEMPIRVGSKPMFGAGTKGQCLKRFKPPGKVNLTADVFSANKQNIAVSNIPPIMTGREGAVAFWIKNSSPFWNTVFDTYDFHLDKDRDRISICIAPVDAKLLSDTDLSHWKRGRVNATIIGKNGTKTQLASKPFDIGVWNHVTLTWSSSEMSLYFNGKKIASKLLSSAPELYLTDAFYLARSYMGDIDEAVIFNKKLSQKEVSRLYANKDVGKMKGLVFYMPFEGDLKYKAVRKPLEFKEAVITFPRNRQSYFLVGTELPLKALLPASMAKDENYSLGFSLEDIDGKKILDKEAIFSGQSGRKAEHSINIKALRCGVYWLNAVLKDSKGKELYKKTFNFAYVTKLPPLSEVPASSPLGVQPMVAGWMPEGRFLGAKWDRFWMRGACWENIELQPGIFYWGYLDTLVEEAKKENTEILFTIHGTPEWLSTAPSSDELQRDYMSRYGKKAPLFKLTRWINCYEPKDLKNYELFLRKLVERYKGRVKYWEIWNEPNASFRVIGDSKAKAYVRFLKMAYKTIHETDPDAKVVGGDAAPYILPWTREILDAGAWPYFDILSVHNYNYGSPIKWNKQELIHKVKALLRTRTGKDIAVWNTETGFGQIARVNGRPMSEQDFIAKYKDISTKIVETTTTERRCACWEVQSVFLDLSAGAAKTFLHSGFGVSRFAGTHEHFPTEKGVAYAAMSKVLSFSKSVSRLSFDDTDVALFIVEDLSGKRSAVLFADKKTSLYFPVARNKKYTGMDFLGNPLTFSSDNSLLQINCGVQPIYIFDVPSNFSAVKFIDVDAPQEIVPEKILQGKLEISNPFPKTLKGELDCILPKNWKIKMKKDFEIVAGGKTTVPFFIEPGKASRGSYKMQLKIIEKGKCLTVKDFFFLCKGVPVPVFRTPEKIKLGPALMEVFKKIKAWKVDSIDHVKIGLPNPMFPKEFPHWESADDLSYETKLTWAYDDALYLQIKVKDNLLHVSKDGKSPYTKDCIELFFDGRREANLDKKERGAGTEQLLIIPPLSKNFTECKVLNPRSNSTLKTEFIGKRTKDGYVVIGAIKPSAGSFFKLVPGCKFGLDIAIDDCDAPSLHKSRKTQMVWMGTEDNHKDTSKWGRFMLCLEKK